MTLSSPNQNISSPQQPATGSGRKLAPLRSWRKHVELSLVIFLGVLVLGIPVALKKSKPKYSAEAVIVVWPRFLKNLEDDKEFDLQSNTQYREFVQQNVRTVDRYDIIEEAINRLDKTPHPWRKKNESLSTAIGRLRSNLSVVPIPDTYQIALRMEAGSPGGLPETLNMVVTVFLERSKDEELYGRDQRVDSLKAEAGRLTEQIDSLGKEKSTLGEELGVTVFGENLVNPYDRLLVESKEALATARQKQIITAADLASMEAHTGSQNDSAVKATAFDMAQKNPALMTLQSNLNLRRSELMAKLSGMLPTHPGRAAMEKEIADIDSLLKSRNDALSDSYSSMLLTQRRAEAASAAQADAQFQKEVDAQAVQAAQYSEKYQKGVYLSMEMQRAQRRLEAIDDRLNFIALESDAPGFAHMFSPARNPATRLGSGPKRMIMIVAVAALALGLIVPLILDLLDPHVLTPAEAEAKMGFPPLGFTYVSGQGAKAVMQVRRLAAAIDREAARNGSRTYQFVPADESTKMDDLLDGIAEELRTLDHSVCVLSAERNIPFTYPVGAGRHYSSLACAPRMTDSDFGSLRRALTLSASPNQFVLLSSGSFSTDAESELLATTSDVVVLAVQAGRTTKAQLIASAKTLQRIQPKAVALVVMEYNPNPPAPPLRLARLVGRITRPRSAR